MGIGVAFPYPTTTFEGGTDWRSPQRHSSAVARGSGAGATAINHTMDNTTYFVHARPEPAAATLRPGAVAHDWTIAGEAGEV